MKYIMYSVGDNSKIGELNERDLNKLKMTYGLKDDVPLDILDDTMRGEAGLYIKAIEDIKGGDYKYTLTTTIGFDMGEQKFRTLDEFKDWINNNTYADPLSVSAWTTFEELKEYMDREYGTHYEIKTTEKSREQLIYERIAKVKRPKNEFKLGARVRAKGDVSYMNMKGKIGTIVHLKSDTLIGVGFDTSFGFGNDCESHARDGHGRYGSKDEFELI